MTEVTNGQRLRDAAVSGARLGTPAFTGFACYLLYEVLTKLDRVLDKLNDLAIMLARVKGG